MTGGSSLTKNRTSTTETGSLELFMVKAPSKPTSRSTLGASLIGSNMEPDSSILSTEMSTGVSTRMEDLMGLEHMSGRPIQPYTRETSKMDLDMGKVNGRQGRLSIAGDT